MGSSVDFIPQDQESRDPSLGEAILDMIRRQLSKILVARPGTILAFNATTGYATVRPLLANLAPQADGSLTPAALPDLYNVPVFFMGGGGLRVTTPVVKGDLALLFFCDRSLDDWKAAPTTVTTPVDGHSHALSGAIALVGLKAWTGPSATAIQIGADAGALPGALPATAFQGVALGQIATTVAYFMDLAQLASIGPLAAYKTVFSGLVAALGQTPGFSASAIVPTVALDPVVSGTVMVTP